jgi:spermidine synthase
MVAVLAATVLGRGSLVLIEIPEEWKVLEQRESVMGVVTVSERVGGSPQHKLRRLQVDQQFRMGGALSIGERRMGHIPLLLHGEAKNVLYLGVGTGATAGAALAHPVESIDAVELVPEVLDALPYFEDVNGKIAEAERAHLHAADARRWLAASDQAYDVIVADLFHPERDGAGFLYSREHFEAVRDHLADGGVFAQWLPLHQIDPDTLRVVIATFLDVFPEAHSWLALYNVESPAFGLIGTAGQSPLTVDLARLTETTRDPAFAPVVLQDPRDLFAGYMLDREALTALAGDAPLNTDLRPRVLFDAPKSGRDHLGRVNLEILVPLRTPYPSDLVDVGDRSDFESQTATFAQALDHYLNGEMIFVRDALPDEPLPEAAVEEYVAAFEATPEFLPAHGRLKAQIALLQRAGFEEEARALVERLNAVTGQ